MANFWLQGGGGGATAILVILLSSCHGPVGVSAQLYTDLDDLIKVHNLPSHPPKFNTTTVFNLGDPKEAKDRTCMVPFQVTEDDENPNVADEWSWFKGLNLQKYFCANMPNFHNTEVPDSSLNKQGTKHTRMAGPSDFEGDRVQMPHAQFWLKEPTSHHWGWARLITAPAQMNHYNEVKNRKLLFLIEVTGIQSRGRFLKGWYHLRIKWIYDKDSAVPDKRYIIDKLMVTARGRTLVPGKPRILTYINATTGANVTRRMTRPPRRAWVGGIGQFVQDFPPCSEKEDYPDMKYIQQQFMPCGTVQYAEAQYGNNFYYSRQNNVKYGYKYAQYYNNFQLNFRLDNSFCNRYYELDFVAIGMLKELTSDGQYTPLEGGLDKYQAVLRSVSTRIIFASSYAHHQPDYYENADPVPRNVPNVDCSHQLRGEWEMNEPDGTTPTPTKHWMSVSKGADLKLSGARPDATFNGAIKFIIPAPNTTSPEKQMYHLEKAPSKTDFSSRRTWAYSSRLLRSHVHDNPFRWWMDATVPMQKWTNSSATVDEIPRIEMAVQRVLNEMDWETWVERMEVIGKGTPGGKALTDCSPDNVYKSYSDWKQNKGSSGWSFEAGYWPNHYYDVTCGGLSVHTSNENVGIEYKYHPQNALWNAETAKNSKWEEATSFHKALPPISGRCEGSLFFNSGLGNKVNPPPRCNEFFHESELWTDNVEKYNQETGLPQFDFLALADPALARVVQGMRRQTKGGGGRHTFNDHYLADTLDDRNQLTCELAEALWGEKPDCTFIPPRPYTPRAPYHVPPTKEEQAVLDWEDKQKRDHKTTPAYTRGLLVSENPYSLYIWDSRLIHGCFMTVLTIFVTPISIFFTRYYKETFMDTRILLHHIWYFVHIIFSLCTQLLLLVGMWRQAKAKDILGVSLGGNSKVHRIVGWIMVGLSGFLFISGGIRTMHRKIRAATMLIHWFGGMIFYACCLLCMLSSFGIPASPAAYHDYTTSGFHTKLQEEAVFITIVVWIVFDIIMHAVMTILQCRNDKKMKLTESRFYFLSPMPVIAETFRFDTPGRFPRIYLLGVYIFMSFAATTVIIVFMYNYSPRGRGLGFMSCTHSSDPGHEVFETFPKDC